MQLNFAIFVVAVVGAAQAAPQLYLADTPEVQEAKIEFAEAYNRAALTLKTAQEQALLQAQLTETVEENDPEFSPPAEPYVHEEVPAVPYVHQEVPYLYNEGVNGEVKDNIVVVAQPPAPISSVAAPVQQVLPVFTGQVPASYAITIGAPIAGTQVQGPVQQFAHTYGYQNPGGCYNWRGEGVPCRY